MKSYINIFYAILEKVDSWDNLDQNKKNKIFNEFLNLNNKSLVLTQYFENYRKYLEKNTFNSLLKGVIKPNF